MSSSIPETKHLLVRNLTYREALLRVMRHGCTHATSIYPSRRIQSLLDEAKGYTYPEAFEECWNVKLFESGDAEISDDYGTARHYCYASAFAGVTEQ